MSSSLGLLAGDIQISLCHSLTGTAEPPPLVTVEPTAELQQSLQFSWEELSPSYQFPLLLRIFFLMVKLLMPIKIPLSLLFSWVPHQNP
jgi:hypothetical protein